ncbi:MAG: LON peptidase substrate-binding domain-containing protein [Deltaproteobacteria bacterium]
MPPDPTPRIPLEALPVFPLASTVLFPEQQLPLHIFEPRYRQMVRDALDTSPYLVVALIEGDPNVEPTRLARVATVGKIVANQRLADGRYNILIAGAVRVAIEEIESARPYRQVRCMRLETPDASDPAGVVPESERTAMVSLLGLVMQQTRRTTPSAEFKAPVGLDASQLSFRIAERVITDPGWRQRVLEAETAVARVRRTTEALASLLGDLPGIGSRGAS